MRYWSNHLTHMNFLNRFLGRFYMMNVVIPYCNNKHLTTDTYELKLWGPHAMKYAGVKIINELLLSAGY